jgi:uncharacterized protein (DUF2147 family)
MKQLKVIALVAGLVISSGFVRAVEPTPTVTVVAPPTATLNLTSAVGKWKSIDDETGKPKSIIEITEGSDTKLSGKITQLFREPTEDQNPKCDKCSGDKKDQPILNMQIMQGFKKKSDGKWADGEILDPKNGKVYSCKLSLTDGGKKLEVRGFIGFSLLGRTQVWVRE